MPFVNRLSSTVLRELGEPPAAAAAAVSSLSFAPSLWYKNENLPASLGSWPNSGALGTTYNLTTTIGSPTITTVGGFKCIALTSTGSGIYWSGAGNLTIHTAGQATPFALFVACLNNSGDYTAFVGSAGTPSPAANGIGTFSSPTHYEWYDNDGGPLTASSPGGGSYTQQGYVHTDNNVVRWYESKTASAFFTGSGSYGAALNIRGITQPRNAAASYAMNSRIFEMILLIGRNITDAEITEVRSYLGAKFSSLGGRINS